MLKQLTIIPMSSIRALSVEEQDKLARQVIVVETNAKSATEAHKLSFPMAGKIVCAIEERLNELKSDRNSDGTPKKRMIAANTSLSTYWETVTKVNGKSTKLNNHALSCAVAFGTYVRSELITEADYDKCKADWLEVAASIATACGGSIENEAVHQAAEELRDRSKDCAKNLREILATVKEPKALTVEQAQKALEKIIAGGHLNLVIAGIGAEIAHMESTEDARSAYFGMVTAMDMFNANVDANGARRFSDDTMDAWLNTYQAENGKQLVPIETTQEEQPVAAAA
jgi:hypothetical protein